MESCVRMCNDFDWYIERWKNGELTAEEVVEKVHFRLLDSTLEEDEVKDGA